MNRVTLGLVLLICISCAPPAFKTKWTEEKAPEYFQAKFETTQGDFKIEARREWSPAGVDRLYQLIKRGFYEDIAIYRVVPDFVVQFGIHTDSTKNTAWTGVKVPDEPVIKLNELGTISFARGGIQTRSTQLFINIKNNSPRLDELDYSGVKGFPAIAQVTEGMEVVEKFYGAYGNQPATKQGAIYAEGNAFLKANYPELDYITKAYIIK